MKIEKLFTPIRLGTMELRNRISMPAMHLNYEYGGEMNDRLIQFYAERAKGGVGLIIIGGCSIDKLGGGPIFIGLDDDRFIPGLARFNEEIHRHGAKTCAQLYQAGRYSFSLVIGQQPAGPSAVASGFTRETPRELSKDEIHGIVHAFGSGAARAKKAGFDAVEILGSAGYLISQFLSPVSNLRQDEYGGTFENRMRFPREVIEEVRASVGHEFPILVRVAGNDFIPGGNTNRECQVVCKIYAELGVDAIDVTGGWHETRVPQLTTFVPRGAYVYCASRIRMASKLPVIASNRMNDVVMAERLVRDGVVDMVNMGRALIADPDLPNKAREGRVAEIRMCMACNQGCFDAVFNVEAVSCAINPRAGREYEILVKPAEKVKKILVIGGGPGGMEAARLASERGHKVTLVERTAELGGQLHLCSAIEERREFANFLNYLIAEMKRLKVDVRFGVEADEKLVAELAPDAVIVATGARPIVPKIPGADRPNVKQAWDVLLGSEEVGEKIAIIGGGAVGCEVALHLARIGTIDGETLRFLLENDAEDIDTLRELVTRGTKSVTILEMLPKIGQDIGRSTRWTVLQELKRRGIAVRTGAKAAEITAEGVLVETDGKSDLVRADTVILAIGSRSENALAQLLKGKVKELAVVGDAQKPRKVLEAVQEAFAATLEI